MNWTNEFFGRGEKGSRYISFPECAQFASVEQLVRIADAMEKQVEIAQKTLDRINEIK